VSLWQGTRRPQTKYPPHAHCARLFPDNPLRRSMRRGGLAPHTPSPHWAGPFSRYVFVSVFFVSPFFVSFFYFLSFLLFIIQT
jgi:hypothetical protein